MLKERELCHLNIVGFKAAVAAVKDRSLDGRPFVIAGASGGRSLALDASPEAVRQGVTPGTALAVAQRRIKELIVLPPDISAYEAMNKEIEKVASMYAPVWENDKMGNLYLDITGTSGLFGPPIDCSNRVLKDIFEKTSINPAAAVASNKLVSKVATRTIRPFGLIQVQAGTEAAFLSHQDIKLLPGMGQNLLRTAAAAGIREIGEIAVFSQAEASALFGKHGVMLRSMALGLDTAAVRAGGEGKRIIHQADFNEDEIDETAIKGAMEVLVEHGGLEMRSGKMGTARIGLAVRYSDGMEVQKTEKLKHILVTDKQIMQSAFNLYKKIVTRRIRIRSICLCLEDITPLGYQPDLFEPEPEIKSRKLQEAADRINMLYGAGRVTKGLVLAAKGIRR